MNDVLERLYRTLPSVSGWIDRLLAEHSPSSMPVNRLRLPRVAAWFPAHVVRDTTTSLVSKVPFPPVSAYGLPEFEAMAQMPMAGITFRNTYFVHEAHNCESIHVHELVHVIQWRVLGFDQFLLTYGAGVLQCGYADSPLEAAAFGIQADFERGASPPPTIADTVAEAALRARDSAAALFRAHGLTLDA